MSGARPGGEGAGSGAGAGEIVFIVPGLAVAPGGATRGGGAMAGPAGFGGIGGFAGQGTVTQRVQVGALRGAGEPVRLVARPGLDAVVLHIANGPSLMLHPETARDLMLAQAGGASRAAPASGPGQVSGAASGAESGEMPNAATGPLAVATSGAAAAPSRSRRAAAAAVPNDEIAVPVRLGWHVAGPAPVAHGATRGAASDVMLSAIDVVTGLLGKPAARFSAQKIGAHVDDQVDAGVYALDGNTFNAALKGTARPLASVPPAPGGEPLLVLLHGTFSQTQGTFGKLWSEHPQKVQQLFAHYGGRVYGLDHPTLTVSPIANALMLAQALPDGARVHLLTHSRGGLVGEVLARMCANPTLDAQALAAFADPKYKNELDLLRQLAAALKGRDICIERVVRVACPARGTLLASRRMDAYVSVLKWALELAGVPVAPALVDFIGELASQRTDPAVLPGVEAMTPDSALVQWLHAGETEAPLPGHLNVVAGDAQGDSVMSWVKTLLADAFFWSDNDLVVQTRSMYGGAPRAGVAGQPGATFVFDQGGAVSHFNYFSNARTADAICAALTQPSAVAAFRPIGPLSWSGTAGDGLRGAPPADAALAAGATAAAERPAVFVLPGIMGSHLRLGDQRVWLSSRAVTGLLGLAFHEGASNVQPDGSVGAFYSDLVDFLSASHEVIEFPFDWRRPLEDEARRLADALDAAVAAREGSGQPVRLLAHSMGGLLARTVQLERPDSWARWLAHPGARLLMLGTPNGGSFAPMQMLSGDDSLGNVLASFGQPFKDDRVRQMLAEMPGFLQLQAGLLDAGTGLSQSRRWQALADQDLALVRQGNAWHVDELQRNALRWGVPPQAVLDRAVALRRRLDQQRDDALSAFSNRIVMVVGHARFTPAAFELRPIEGLVYLDAVDQGDGRVTLANALLPGVRAWRTDCVHGDLCNHKAAFAAYLDLLQAGDTQRLPAVEPAASPSTPVSGEGASTRAASEAAAGLPLLQARGRPSRTPNAANPPPSDMTGLFNEAPAPAAAPAPHTALRVSIHNANLKFVSTTLMLGHYGALALSGAEEVVDGFIGGAMSASLAAGLYPEAPGSHQVFVNTRQSPDNPLALPRPPQVVVAGLGEEGKLRSADLTRTVRQATMGWAQRVAERPGNGAAPFELAATLIGSGGTGISVAASAQAVAQGVREANEKLQAGGWPQCSHLRLVELYLDRATEAWHGLQMLAEASPECFELAPAVLSGTGALRRPLDGGYRGSGYDFISATTDHDEFGEPKIVYTLDTKRARSEVRAQSTQSRLVKELVRRASNDANRDTQIGRTLFQLLVPVEMEANLAGSSEMLIELDDGSAAIPWELLDPADDGGSGPLVPWAIRSKLLRKLRTVEFRQQVSDARIEDAVLVIGEPLVDASLYPPLPGARAEAEAVRDALMAPSGGGPGLEPSRVHALISTGDGEGPDAAAVTGELLAHRYRIIHISGHGEPPELVNGQPRLRGVVLSDGTFIGPREVQSMRVVPELVFLNCCHLAADPDKLLKEGYDRAAFAAGVAKQLIRVGVRCVVAAGWAVEDAAASTFAAAFYRALLGGQRFMDAVHAARVAARDVSPLGNTWAAYQCYGDPDWVWRRGDDDDPRRAPPPVASEFVGIASPVALALALETLAVRSATQGADPARQVEKIRHLEARFGAIWGGMGAVAEAFGLACANASDTERAIAWYRRALAANDGSATLAAGEKLANLLARHAWERIEQAQARQRQQPQPQQHRQPGPPRTPGTVADRLFAQGRRDIQASVDMLTALVTVSPTIERESMLGSAHKRLALLEAAAGRKQPEAEAATRMAGHYRRAEALAVQAGHPEAFYPALNRMAADLAAHAHRPDWRGFGTDEVAAIREGLERKQREDPDFWSLVGLPELRVYEALAARQLAPQLPAILAVYEDLHARAGSAWKWASVFDQAGWVLKHFSGGTSAEAQAATRLLAVLRGYAGR